MSNNKSLIEKFNEAPSWAVVLGTLGAVGVGYAASKIYQDPEGFKKYFINKAFSAVSSVAGNLVDGQFTDALESLEEELFLDDVEIIDTIPEEGWGKNRVIEFMNSLNSNEKENWENGKVSGCVYNKSNEHIDLLNQAMALFTLSNPLHPDVFPSIKKFESEIISMTIDMLAKGVDGVCGAMTSGGTESILMACKAHRDYYEKNKGITRPNIVAPSSAHAAFNKACEYFKIELRLSKLGKDHRADVADLESKIDSNTILIVGSAPSYAHGMIDDIEAIAALAIKYGTGCHVDGCLGGFILPWIEQLEDSDIPPFDFRVKGVTSMSADTHKYGYAVKGSSVILFANEDLRRSMYFVYTAWPGGLYCTTAIGGSRPGCLIAGCWASLVSTGKDGYLDHAREIFLTASSIKQGIIDNDDYELVGDSKTMVIAFKSKNQNDLNIFGVMTAMKERGWNLNPLQNPLSIHICVTYAHKGKGDQFVEDLNEATAQVKKDKKKYNSSGAAPIYGLAYSISGTDPVDHIVKSYLDITLTAKRKHTSNKTNNNNEN
eukprot:TRINITY_DN901_c0_g1_i1.p1 TRINITY_DN901_c0_g1~~TRINITY_DN901_c0_g1_i1.p1  ORF type:complete len:546 (-),score=218.26 TRINITY_DN901_c0_g1_i1:67-1704(-)